MKKIFGILCLALACVSGFKLVKSLNSGERKPSSGSKAYDSGSKAGGYLAPVIMVALGLWLLTRDDSTTPTPAPRRLSGPLPPPGHPSLRGGMDTFASNPARLRVDWLKWLLARPGPFVVAGGALVLGLWITFFVKAVPGLCILASIPMTLYWTVAEARGKFFRGDVCAGVVLDAGKGLVAAMTDLSNGGGGARPAVKIVRQPLGKMNGDSAQDGMRVATVAFYYGSPRADAWKDFDPEVINCFVNDPAEIQRVFESISEAEWQALDAALARMPGLNPGLYRLWGPHAGQPKTSLLTHKATLIGVAVAGGLVVAAFLLNTVLHRSDDAPRRATVASRRFATPPAPVEPAATPDVAPARIMVQPTPTSVELGDKIVSVTTLSGRVYDNIKLVRADYSGVTYLTEAGGGRIPLAALPLEFLEQIGVPTNWPGILRPVPAATPGAAGLPATPGGAKNFAVGDRVTVQWAGKLQSAVILTRRGPSVQLRMADPNIRIPLWMSTNQVHYP